MTAWFRALAVAVTGVLVFTGCTQAIDGPKPISDSSIPAELQSFYTQNVDWSACGGEQTYCGEVQVPLDWQKPSAGELTLAVAFRKADNADSLGSIIFNPGGPGGSGYTWITGSAEQLGTADLRANYNLVGFDPRGVGASEPKVVCLDNQGTDNLLYGQSSAPLNSAADIAATREAYKNFAQACLENTGPNLGYIDTVSAARDMDVLRSVFGEEQINYLGFSYGTFLGATYAELYPSRVGRMVLDGAIDPTLSDEEQSIGQLIGFDQALKNYLVDCLGSSDCPFSGSLESAQRQISYLLRALEDEPVPTQDGRGLTIWGAVTGMIMPLYSQDYWQYLNQAFSELQQNHGTTFLLMADLYNERNEDGTYASNQMEANIAISCLDARSSSDADAMAAQNERALATSTVFGRYWQNGAIGCEYWPFAVADHPKTYRASGSKTILVIGTTGDPATPYSQAVSLANDVLENAQLITWNGEGHTAYGQGSKCIEAVVDDYFINDVVPTEDPNC